MNNEKYTLYKTFTDLVEAKQFHDYLEKNKITSLLIENKPPLDITFANNQILTSYEIHVAKSDLKLLEDTLEVQTKELLKNLDENHYLFSFSKEELLEILAKPDEWNSFDYELAKTILTQRGIQIDIKEIQFLKKARLEELRKPEKSKNSWIIAGYILALLGGPIGIIIGYSLAQSKKNLPNGDKVYVYTAIDRMHGSYIFYLGIFTFILFLIYKFIA